MTSNQFATLPNEVDLQNYRLTYEDLADFDDQRLRQHFRLFGAEEGRIGSTYALRENFVTLFEKAEGKILEIGPFNSPLARGKNVEYFDVVDTAGLVARAKALGFETEGVPDIQFVSDTADLEVIKRRRFDIIVASHCIEHQPDLVRHLQQVEKLLGPKGLYFLIVPDKRYCFDHFIAESTLAAVLQAREERRRVHTLESVIEHRALTTHSDPTRHWVGDHVNAGQPDDLVARTRLAIAEHRKAKGSYVDVHAWQFTPESFRRIIASLNELGETRLRPARVFSTPKNRNEFTAILTKD